jgi:hypothetical protein
MGWGNIQHSILRYASDDRRISNFDYEDEDEEKTRCGKPRNADLPIGSNRSATTFGFDRVQGAAGAAQKPVEKQQFSG